MTGEIRCRCGATLVEEITDRGVRPLGGDSVIPFRRNTDFVVCQKCMRTYSIDDLIGIGRPDNDASVIEALERLINLESDEPSAN